MRNRIKYLQNYSLYIFVIKICLLHKMQTTNIDDTHINNFANSENNFELWYLEQIIHVFAKEIKKQFIFRQKCINKTEHIPNETKLSYLRTFLTTKAKQLILNNNNFQYNAILTNIFKLEYLLFKCNKTYFINSNSPLGINTSILLYSLSLENFISKIPYNCFQYIIKYFLNLFELNLISKKEAILFFNRHIQSISPNFPNASLSNSYIDFFFSFI